MVFAADRGVMSRTMRAAVILLAAALCCTSCEAWTPTLDVLPSHRDVNTLTADDIKRLPW
jgi:hypothetical protein